MDLPRLKLLPVYCVDYTCETIALEMTTSNICNAPADAQRGATYGNYTADRVIYAPTDLVSVLARILAYNSSDQATAYNLGKGYNISAYNPGGRLLQAELCSVHASCIFVKHPSAPHKMSVLPLKAFWVKYIGTNCPDNVKLAPCRSMAKSTCQLPKLVVF